MTLFFAAWGFITVVRLALWLWAVTTMGRVLFEQWQERVACAALFTVAVEHGLAHQAAFGVKPALFLPLLVLTVVATSAAWAGLIYLLLA